MISANKGHIVTIASSAGLTGVCKMTDYCASKYAAVGLNESLRNELNSMNSNVKTTCVCPYYINTGMFNGVSSHNFLLPILEEDWASSRIVTAIRYDEPVLIMPSFTKWCCLLRCIFPVWVGDFTARILGINKSMDTFKGRN